MIEKQNSFKPKKIIIYTRPWEVYFHLKLAKKLIQVYSSAKVEFVTYFSYAESIIREKGYKCTYMPKELKKVNVNSINNKDICNIDNKLYEQLNLNLNKILYIERFLPKNANDKEVFLKKHLIILDKLISENTLSISSMYDHFIYLLGGSIANIRGGGHFAFLSNGIPGGRVLALKTPNTIWRSEKIFDYNEDLTIESVKSSLRIPPEKRMEYMKKNEMPPLKNRILFRKKQIFYSYKDYKNNSYFSRLWTPWNKYIDKIRKNIRKFQNNKIMDIDNKNDLDNMELNKCVYIPLHMEPEASILTYSTWFRDQLKLIRVVAQSIPKDFYILVKENPKMLDKRKIKFYKKAKEHLKVKLVHPKISSVYLSEHSNCVISLTGNASLEANLLGNKGFFLGNPPFKFLVPKMKIKSFDEFQNHLFNLDKYNYNNIIKKEKWERWLKGSFKAEAVPRYIKDNSVNDVNNNNNLTLQINYEDKNVESYADYIISCLK